MPFKFTTYKLYLYNKILYINTIIEFPYFNCETKNYKYFIILDSSLKYIKYIYLDYSYINIS